jgi:hypothetical protein
VAIWHCRYIHFRTSVYEHCSLMIIRCLMLIFKWNVLEIYINFHSDFWKKRRVEPFSINQSNLTSHDEQEAPGALNQKQTQNNANKIRVITRIFASVISVADIGKKHGPLCGQTDRPLALWEVIHHHCAVGGHVLQNWLAAPSVGAEVTHMMQAKATQIHTICTCYLPLHLVHLFDFLL